MQATIPLSDFDLPRFIEAIVTFCEEPELAFPVVDDGFAIYDPSTTPMQKLEGGQTLFARFTAGEGERFRLANGTRLDLPDDYDGDGFFDDSSCYGFIVRLSEGQLSISSALMREVREETIIHEAANAGPFEAAMVRFIESMRAS